LNISTNLGGMATNVVIASRLFTVAIQSSAGLPRSGELDGSNLSPAPSNQFVRSGDLSGSSTSSDSVVFANSMNFERDSSPRIVVRRGRERSVIGFLTRTLLLLGLIL
jgi:hypothetical protein